MQNVTREEDGFMLNITVNKVFTTCGDGYWSDVAKEVFVTDVGMFVSTQQEDGEYYGDGDMYVLYDEATWDNSVDGLIYTDSAFLEQVRTALIAGGVSIEAAEAVTYSEQGMQDDGRVSLDAYEVADYVRTRMQLTA